ncbi:phage tail sheath family protein [Kutzneria albida]|uniref:Uncharacterized protein n=1 Tax=Kutzneria albida DSM 43870 TaxID=1449976 RepID=W5WMS1_9PSEU|nr:phage tail sheath subtilisin-like domain-containing protein [Kutzneria albida]AHH99479.1 hypothetical protein KALB_6119 [Kutzneria albida DSM 43870]
MAEYLTPGVYIEETSFRSRSIEGVPTSTCGMTGLTRYGPVPYLLPNAVLTPKPVLVTSFTEFERAFGGLGPVPGLPDDTNYLAHAARAFFANGGHRLYVQRVFPFDPAADPSKYFAKLALGSPKPLATWHARWPGAAGGSITVRVQARRSRNVLIGSVLRGVAPGAAVEVGGSAGAALDPKKIRIVAGQAGALGYRAADGSVEAPTAGQQVYHVSLDVTVNGEDHRSDTYSGLELDRAHPRWIGSVLQAADPPDEFSLVWLEVTDPVTDPGALLAALLTDGARLSGGQEGVLSVAALQGEVADPDDVRKVGTGLAALGEIEDIAIVAMPDAVRFGPGNECRQATQALLDHCKDLRYRVAVVDPPRDCALSQVREFRAQFDSTYGALYYPWVELVDPTAVPDPSAPTPTLQLPPSGSVAGIYARSDIERGVHKAPANEVVQGITRFVTNITYDRQAVLNPEGVNALRFFAGRSNRVWGARTMSSDPEWKYVNVRRLFAYLEHSIEKATQWAVFEPNNERLWASVRQSIEDFLLVTWRSGALMGTKPEQAYFVRCDRTTMTQNDLDNGRLICLIGVAPTYPAEFVIFRIGQWTADAQTS